MKGLKKIALVTAIAAAPFAAQAELKALNDASMGNVTGQAGVTIDLSANVEVAEIAYQDKGFLVIDGLKLGGHSGLVAAGFDGAPGTGDEVADALDDIRLTVDVAGTDLTDLGYPAPAGGYAATALATDKTTGTVDTALQTANGTTIAGIETDQAVSDGDLVIALRSQSGNPVDFGLGIASVSLAKEANNTANIGSLVDHSGTVLVSDLQINGFLGPIDIVVQEESNSMNINAYFNAAGSMTLDFMGTSLGFELHNRRGDAIKNASGTMSFAHAQVDVSVKEGYFNGDQVVGTGGDGDALAVNVQDFSGDLDLTNITMGNGASIGSLYMTDLSVTAETVIYGH